MAGKRGGDRWPVALGPTEASDVRRLRLSIAWMTSGFLAGATPQGRSDQQWNRKGKEITT